MTQTRLLKTAGVITAFAAIILAGMMNNSRRVRARDDDGGDEREQSRIRRGSEIRPCLNLEGETRRWWDWVVILLTPSATAVAATPPARRTNLLRAVTRIFFLHRLAGNQL